MIIRITADSACDLPAEIIESYGICILPLYINMGGVTYRDGVDIFPADIFRHVEAGGSLPATAAGNPADYFEFFKERSAGHDAVMHVTIGSDFSTCFQNASLAAREFPNVFVVDSKNLSSGQGHVVVEAAKMAKSGCDPREICDALEDLTKRVETSFMLDRLDYLSKGGRCSSVTAMGANLLRLKPCIELINGKMGVGKKYRGAFEKCMRAYVKGRLAGRGDVLYDRVFITHPAADEAAVLATREAVEECADFSQTFVTRAGCAVSSHCGPNTIGVFYVRSRQARKN